ARNILIAVALAAVAALLTSFYVTSYKRHVQRGEDHVTVLVAKKDIAVGATGADVSGQLSQLDVPRRSVVPGAISSADQLAGLVATEPTLEGEQVTTRRFSPRTNVGVRAQLSGTLRAVSLEGDQNQLLAGTLKDGDRVDFVAALKKPGDQDIYFSRVLVRDLKVLRAPSSPPPGTKLAVASGGSYNVMLALTDSQAQKLQYMLANASGSGAERWHLELRPVAHDADSPDHLDSFESVLTGGLRAGQRKTLGR
ncbi:MAG TPA: Flp pilus assembly protein CpaB, partial [Gaiellaceae bacterium]|nr:Flp pilus assembly protein CpaB [Gaiellaceae bacterium]